MIIGLGGELGSGKSTIAKYLSTKYKLPIISFASPLKELVTSVCGLNDSHKNSNVSYEGIFNVGCINTYLKRFGYDALNSNEINNLSAIEYHNEGDVYRILLQYIGTDIVRKRNDKHWVDRFKDAGNKCANGFICDDVRFFNEWKCINSAFTDSIIVTINIIDPDKNTNKYENHISEKMGSKIPFGYKFINKKTTLDELYETFDLFLNNIIYHK